MMPLIERNKNNNCIHLCMAELSELLKAQNLSMFFLQEGENREKGQVMTWGNTPNCISGIDADAFYLSGLTKNQVDRHTMHLSQCSDCQYMMESKQNFWDEYRQNHPVLFKIGQASVISTRVQNELDEYFNFMRKTI